MNEQPTDESVVEFLLPDAASMEASLWWKHKLGQEAWRQSGLTSLLNAIFGTHSG